MEISLCIREQSRIQSFRKFLSFDFQGCLGGIHEIFYSLQECLFVAFVIIADTCHIYGNNSYRASHLCWAKQSISSLDELCEVQLQSTAHTSHCSWCICVWIFFFDAIALCISFENKLWSDEILEIWYSILCSHNKYVVNQIILPWEFFSNIICWNRKGKNSSFCISLCVDFKQCFINNAHFWFQFSKWFTIFSRINSS